MLPWEKAQELEANEHRIDVFSLLRADAEGEHEDALGRHAAGDERTRTRGESLEDDD